MEFIIKNKVFILGLVLAVLQIVHELFLKETPPSAWVLVWSVLIGMLSYLANNLRAQAASILSILASSAASFFQANQQPTHLTATQVVTTYVIPAIILIIGLFYTSPVKTLGYEKTGVIEAAKAQGNEITKEM